MFNRQSLHIALLLWGCIFSLVAALCALMIQSFDREKRHWLLAQQLTCAVLLGSDALAWGSRGITGPAGMLAVRVSNFLVFACSDVILLLFHGYLCSYLFPASSVRPRLHRTAEAEPPGTPTRRIRGVTLLALVALGLVILAQPTSLYYRFDEQNVYHRCAGYPLSVLLPMAGMLLDLSLLVQYRRRIDRELFVAMLSYVVLPLAAMAIQVFNYGISLINISISVAMLLMFLETTIEQNRRAAEQDRRLAQMERELTESRIATMMSQIRNHFIFNTLGVISG